MRVRSSLLGLGLIASIALQPLACNQGPFPDFLEPLDVVTAVDGEAEGWILSEEDSSTVLVLSEDGQFMRSIIGHNTSVDVEFGEFLMDGEIMQVMRSSRFVFPKETGGVNSRGGARPQEPLPDEELTLVRKGATLSIDGWGEFTAISKMVSDFDLSLRGDRGCLMKLVQLGVRTVQARIRNLGGGGTVIYLNNESSFSGFIGGETRIIVENALSPDTTITHDHHIDFPELELDGAFISHVNTSGDGLLDRYIGFSILDNQPADGEGGSGNGSEKPRMIEGRLIYGPENPLLIGQADVVGGRYTFAIDEPLESSEDFEWSFLEDLDMSTCL